MIFTPGKEQYDFEEGQIILINKPLKWTSFDVVNKVRYLLRNQFGYKKIKVGHCGTLDPLATGLLIVCTGKFTKKIEELQASVKEYVGTFVLGATTPSYDLETEIDNRYSTEGITEEKVREALKSFEGEQEQIPPLFSAKMVDGKNNSDVRAVVFKPNGRVAGGTKFVTLIEGIPTEVTSASGDYYRLTNGNINNMRLMRVGRLTGKVTYVETEYEAE